LHVAGTASAPPDGSDVGEVIRWYRKREGLTQQEAAALLSTTQSRLSKLEKGTQALRDVDELRFIASKLSIPPERLGILPDHSADSVPSRGSVSSSPGAPQDSQEHWKAVRGQMNQNRALLGDLAADLYPQAQRVPNTTVLTRAGWMPSAPVELANVALHWQAEEGQPPWITGGLLRPRACVR
jgi:transcriptional regulator with XRE-family HTH domain